MSDRFSIQASRERFLAATRGIWVAEETPARAGKWKTGYRVVTSDNQPVASILSYTKQSTEQKQANAEFIAHAHQDMARLLVVAAAAERLATGQARGDELADIREALGIKEA